MATKPWSERIPAAIAKGKAMSFDRWGCSVQGDICITAGEVALADLAWETMLFEQVKLYGGAELPPHPALIAYTKKIERISHGRPI